MKLNAWQSGADSDRAADRRDRMVEMQLRRRGIRDTDVLRAMSRVPRHEFVPGQLKSYAYVDRALPIGCQQTISQPLIVASMCEAASLKGDERVLEVGAGSGYGAAVLSELADTVHTVERIPELAERARATLTRLGYANVQVHTADGTLGWPPAAPYDAILVAAGAHSLPESYLDQLAPGGRIIIPIDDQWHGQTLYRITLCEGRPTFEDLGGCAFVPLIGG